MLFRPQCVTVSVLSLTAVWTITNYVEGFGVAHVATNRFSAQLPVSVINQHKNQYQNENQQQQQHPTRQHTGNEQTRLYAAVVMGDDVTALSSNGDDDTISVTKPLRVLIAGAGVGGLALANTLSANKLMNVTVIEQTSQFKRFGGPIQLASNALKILQEMDQNDVYHQIQEKFTVTGDKKNGIKDGIRTEWYAMFDLKSPAEDRSMPYTGVIERPDLQSIYLDALPPGTVKNGDGVESYIRNADGTVTAIMQSGSTVIGDVLIGADGIWSAVRATMRNQPKKGKESGATYSGYTLFAGELMYASPDNGQVGYKVYIGPSQYFVITDIGKGRYQWYAFLARPPGSADTMEKPDGTSKYLQDIFVGWSHEIHAILTVTQEDEIEQRDLYDRPPSVFASWTDNNVALLGDGIHAMMPNLGQGGCQAIEDAYVIAQELNSITKRSHASNALQKYQSRRLVRSAAVQGLSRFASDIIIKGFDTPAKISKNETTGAIQFENFNYAGIVTKMLQPILPIFFTVQFNFLYDGWNNRFPIDIKAALLFLLFGGILLTLLSFEIIEIGSFGLGLEALIGGEAIIDFEAINVAIRELLTF